MLKNKVMSILSLAALSVDKTRIRKTPLFVSCTLYIFTYSFGYRPSIKIYLVKDIKPYWEAS